MTKTELMQAIAGLLPAWRVTVDEAHMVNATADTMPSDGGLVYIEEFNTASVDFSRFGKRIRDTFEVYFVRLTDYENDAIEREHQRDTLIVPAVSIVENYLHRLGVENIQRDVYPRGFDANEVLVHITFTVDTMQCA